MLRRLGVTRDATFQALTTVRGLQRVTDHTGGQIPGTRVLRGWITWTLARKGKLDPVIGRDEEIRRAIQVLPRGTKNNPVLIGEPGVGVDRNR